MLNTASLSLQQAPPISVPFRFFLTAPLFAVLAAIQMLSAGDQMLFLRWLPATLSFTHLITLGFLAMIMCGAMLQMLPVLAGAPVPGVKIVGALTHLLLSMGTLLLVAAFTGAGSMLAAVITLAGGLGVFAAAATAALWRKQSREPGTPGNGMRLALFALVVTLLIGVLIALGYAGLIPLTQLVLATDIHLGWGIAGWIGLLLISVAFQLVPMFNVTPEYPQWMRRHLPRGIFILLLVWPAIKLLVPVQGDIGQWLDDLVFLLVAAAYLLFSVTTLKIQSQRKRQVPDVTLLFWRTGLLSLILCVLLWSITLFYPALILEATTHSLLGSGLLIGFAVSIVNGMLYKIVPFLSWFHLQNRQMSLMDFTTPMPHMKAFITDRAARIQYFLHLSALLALFAAIFYPAVVVQIAGLFLLASNLLLGGNLWLAAWRYRKHHELLTQQNPNPDASP